MATALGDLRQLRALHVGEVDERGSVEVLAAVGKMKQLEILSVSCGLISPDSLRGLADLTDLRSLRLEIQYVGETEHDLEHRVGIRELATLADLPVLPRLEFIGFYGGLVRANDLRQLASLPRLKAIDLHPEFMTERALLELASLEALEELSIGYAVASSRGLESLASLKRLERLHIPSPFLNNETRLRVNSTGEMFVRQSDLARCRHALEALRRARPGVAIDRGDSMSFAEYRTLNQMLDDALRVQRWPQ